MQNHKPVQVCDWTAFPVALYGAFHGQHQRCRFWVLSLMLRGPWSAYHKCYNIVLSGPPQSVSEKKKKFLNLKHMCFKSTLLYFLNPLSIDGALSTYSVLLVIISVMDNDEAQVKTLAKVKQVVCLCFSPAIVVEMHLVLLLRVHWHLHCL